MDMGKIPLNTFRATTLWQTGKESNTGSGIIVSTSKIKKYTFRCGRLRTQGNLFWGVWGTTNSLSVVYRGINIVKTVISEEDVQQNILRLVEKTLQILSLK